MTVAVLHMIYWAYELSCYKMIVKNIRLTLYQSIIIFLINQFEDVSRIMTIYVMLIVDLETLIGSNHTIGTVSHPS